jgi:transposase
MPPCFRIFKVEIELINQSEGDIIMRFFKDIKKFVDGKHVFCGIDIHYKHLNLCFICDGEVIEKIKLPVDYVRLKFLLSSYSTARKISIVYEAGFSGFWLYRNLTKDGYSCIVTPPSRIPKSGSKVKTDKRDAETLASYLAAGLLKSVCVPPNDIESDRRVIRRRAQLVKKQTRAKNHIMSFLHSYGLRTPTDIKTRWSNRYLMWLESLSFEEDSDAFTLLQLIKSYRDVRDDLAEVTRYIRQLSRNTKYEKNFKRISVLRGVGLITGMTFLLELFDLSRFKSAAHFSSFLGLTPAQYSSGEHVRLGHITRQGNAYLRRVLIESAWTVIRHDPHLREKYERIRARGTNGKKAIVAVARSLAVRLRRCLLDEMEYVIGVC